MKKRISFFVFVVSAFLLSGCYPDGPDYIEELDVVLTSHKDTYDFASKATYAMPDTIFKITGNLTEGERPSFVPDVTARPILARISENMLKLGWTKVPVSGDPDLLLLPVSWETTTISYWYDYWYYWWGGYYGGWGWGGYYPPVYVSSYTTGTLVMTLIDKDVRGANGNLITQWTGAISGVMTGVYSANRVNTAIDKAFNQSPYLKTN